MLFFEYQFGRKKCFYLIPVQTDLRVILKGGKARWQKEQETSTQAALFSWAHVKTVGFQEAQTEDKHGAMSHHHTTSDVRDIWSPPAEDRSAAKCICHSPVFRVIQVSVDYPLLTTQHFFP